MRHNRKSDYPRAICRKVRAYLARYVCTSFGNGKSDYMYICSSQSCSKNGQRAIKKTLPWTKAHKASTQNDNGTGAKTDRFNVDLERRTRENKPEQETDASPFVFKAPVLATQYSMMMIYM